MSFPRYEKYKDSEVEWLGKVPDHWLLKRLILLASINDDALAEDTNPDFEMAYVDISSVTPGSKTLVPESLKFGGAPSRARRTAKNGDVLVSTVRTYLRAIAPVIDPPENLIASTGFAVIRPKACCSSVFLNYALQAASFLEEVIARSTGVSYPAINAHDLSFIKLPLPPSKQDQERIGLFLQTETAKMDALIEEQRRLIELLKEKRQAVISHAVTKGLNPGIPMKDSNVDWIGEVPRNWLVTRLGYFATVENGTTPSKEKLEYWTDGQVPWLASGEVNQLRIVEANEFITEQALGESSLRLLPEGTIVVGLVGQGKTRGMSAILCMTATINQNLAAICPGPKISSEYVFYLFQAMYESLREDGRGGNQAAINCKILVSLQVPIPPMREQKDIAAFLNTLTEQTDALENEANRAIDVLQERRSALISAAVTGKIDVRGDRNGLQ